jgi:LysM repeat protein
MRNLAIAVLMLALAALACVRDQPEVIVITATFLPEQGAPQGTPLPVAPPVDTGTMIVPTADPTRPGANVPIAQEYVVQPGDTLSGIAAANGVSVTTLLQINNLSNPDQLEVGQVIQLPEPPQDQGSDFKIVPDSRMVRGPGSGEFNVEEFVRRRPGYIREATDTVNDETFTAAQIVERVALEYSVDPRLLLALLEFKSGWITNPQPDESAKTYPMGAQASPLGFDRNGLYRQLTWAADQLNYGYYGWKNRGLDSVEFTDGTRLRFAGSLNAGTVGVQYLLSQYNDFYTWQEQVGSNGFYRTYTSYFGDPFAGAADPVVPVGLEQPELTFPFPQGDPWFYTGGPHGGWGSGSAWAAIDFAPPDDINLVSSACYVSQFFATAVAPGVIARTDEGTVILDLDGDGDESTGWTVLYLHMAAEDRIAAGTTVRIGDRIGRPSCEGGFSNGTHMHIARRYNGEWIPASCESCPQGQERPPFIMNGWTVVGFTGQEYQGIMVKGNDRRIAEQGRLVTENQVSW